MSPVEVDPILVVPGAGNLTILQMSPVMNAKDGLGVAMAEMVDTEVHRQKEEEFCS